MIISNINEFIKKHNIKNIYLDVDGVLIHSCQAVCDMINEDKGTKFIGEQVLSWNFKEIIPNLTDTDIENLFADKRFFEYVQWIKGAKEFIKNHENNIIIVTKGTWKNICLKMKILFKDLNVEIIGIPLNRSKSEVDMSDGLFIDDCTNNLIESNAKYKIQFCEYNDNLNSHRDWLKGWNGYRMYHW